MKDNFPVVILAVAVLAVGVLQLNKEPIQVQVTSQDGETRVVERQVGASPGPDVYTNTTFHGGVTEGSGVFSTSTTGTLTAKQMEKNKGIYITAGGAGQAVLALTLPASTTLGAVLPNEAGYCRTWFIDASDVAAATTTTITAGTGWNLVGLDATGAGTGADVIDGAEYGTLTACREVDGDVVGYVQEYIAAD